MRESRWLQFDPIILVCAVALVMMGVGEIHSATCGTPCPGVLPLSTFASRQALLAAVGFVTFAVASVIDYRFYRNLAYVIYGVALLLLVAVLVIGRAGADQDYGAKRWIFIGFFDLQASEVAKVAVVLVLARVLGDKPAGAPSLRRVLAALALVLAPMGLVFAEPDMGTSISFLVIFVAMAGVAGIRPRHALGLNFAGVLALPFTWLLMKDYMRQRVITFLSTFTDINHAAFDDGYNVLQARISIGSGGLLGRGYLQGTQTQLDYLRIKQSDFIFSAFAEELGFIGAMVLFGLFVVLIFRLTRVGDRARDDFGRFVAFGLATMLMFQVVANLGANLTLVPVTGIPLPFISYGGTSLLVNLVSLGIAESILLYRVRLRY